MHEIDTSLECYLAVLQEVGEVCTYTQTSLHLQRYTYINACAHVQTLSYTARTSWRYCVYSGTCLRWSLCKVSTSLKQPASLAPDSTKALESIGICRVQPPLYNGQLELATAGYLSQVSPCMYVRMYILQHRSASHPNPFIIIIHSGHSGSLYTYCSAHPDYGFNPAYAYYNILGIRIAHKTCLAPQSCSNI